MLISKIIKIYKIWKNKNRNKIKMFNQKINIIKKFKMITLMRNKFFNQNCNKMMRLK